MFSDNENPGAELFRRTAPQPPRQRRRNKPQTHGANQAESEEARAQDPLASAPASCGAGSCDRDSCGTCCRARWRCGRGAFQRSGNGGCRARNRRASDGIQRRDGTIDGAVRRAASGAGGRRNRIRPGRGDYRPRRGCEPRRQDRRADSRAGIRGTGRPVPSGCRAAGGSAAHRRPQGRHGFAVLPAREAPPRLGQD